MGLLPGEIVADVNEHPRVTLGMLAWLLLLPLAITSARGGSGGSAGGGGAGSINASTLQPRWAHCTTCFAVKRDLRLPFIYAAITAALLGYRT